MTNAAGRYAYGVAAIGFGICALIWHDAAGWPQLKTFSVSERTMLTGLVGVVEILGGLAIFSPRAARAGAIALAVIFGIFALSAVPFIIRHPLIYNNSGNFFEQLSLLSGAVILYASLSPRASQRTARLARLGRYAFGLCCISFALEQYFYLSPTASLVPKWISPGQMFWAIATTVAFILAGIALLTGLRARLAAGLTAAMLLGFALIVWAPALAAGARSFANWSEAIETLAVAATAWMLATSASPFPKRRRW